MSDLRVFETYEHADKKSVVYFENSIKSSYNIKENIESLDVSFEWLELMEDTVRYIDNILRNPNRFIINEEEIVKVEQARRITVESIKHLAKHTSFIQEIEANGDVKPSKILNINKDESYDTYENRVIYTLIQNMRTFIDFKKSKLVTKSFSKNHRQSLYCGQAKMGTENVSINVTMDASSNVSKEWKGKNNSGLTIPERIEKLEMRITDLTNTTVYKTLMRAHVSRVIPPIKKTNLILKNTNFQYAMKLWDFLQNNLEDGSSKSKTNNEYKDDINAKTKFDEIFLLNYLVMDSLTSNKIQQLELTRDQVENLTNGMINKIVEINSDLPIEEITQKIGDKIAVIKNKKEASIEEVQVKLNSKIQSALSKIINFKLRGQND